MSPSKRKLIDNEDFAEDDSIKHRRSSLKVNLSTSNLTDSGNGSLRRTEIQCNKTISDRTALDKTRFESSKHKQSTIDDINLKKIDSSLRNVRSVLEKMNKDERNLSKHYERLKDVILSKTREIFDNENELAIKTALVLKDTSSKKSSTFAINDSVSERQTQAAPNVSKVIGDQLRDGKEIVPSQYIGSTPKNHSKTRYLNDTKFRFKKKRLFLQSKNLDDTSENERDDNIGTNLARMSQLKPGETLNTSPILSCNNKRLNYSRLSLRTSNSENRHCDRSISSIASISEEENIFTAVPIGCSTLINEDISEDEDKVDLEKTKNNNSFKSHTKRNAVSMELTDPRGGFFLSNNEELIKKGHTIANKKITQVSEPTNELQNISKLVCSMQSSKTTQDAALSKNKIETGINNKSACATPSMHMELTVINGTSVLERTHNSTQTIEERNTEICSNNQSTQTEITVIRDQTSLNVNTSIDALNENENIISKTTQKSFKKKKSNIRKRQQSETKLPVSEKSAEETFNTVHTSLQMNTSIDTIDKKDLQRKSDTISSSLPRKKSWMKSTESSGTNKNSAASNEEDLSLLARLRNISLPYNTRSKTKSKSNKTIEIDKNDPHISTENRSKKSTNESKDDPSHIEATPYPMSRTLLIKSLLKQTMAQNANTEKQTVKSLTNSNRSVIVGENSAKNKLIPELSADMQYPPKSIILDDSTSSKLPFTKKQATVIIEESAINHDSDKDQNTESLTKVPPARKGRKLQPLHRSSQLISLTPVEEDYQTPKKAKCLKKRKVWKRKAAKKNLRKNGDNVEVPEKVNSLQDDFSDFPAKKDDQKKPRKINSKKLVIKKIINEDIMKALEKNRGNRNEVDADSCVLTGNSACDFQIAQQSSTQTQRNKSKKIIIVTTGLSKEDKSLVKTVIKTLGIARIEPNVTRRTTHVVSTGVRTINLMHGIIRGCWLVSLEWVLKSLENNEWLNPENYEMTHFSKAVLENRRDRQLYGAYYVSELFTTCGYMYVENGTTPPCNVLKDLIKTAGGCITENLKTAKIVVGKEGLKENWVLDCITTGELQSCNQYRRN